MNIFYTTANCVNVGIASNCAEAQNSWENLEKSETQKLDYLFINGVRRL